MKERLTDWDWRLNNLYHITDKAGRTVKFEMNWAQRELYEEMHYLNCILKARQLGFSTFILMFMTDACVFSENVACGIVDVSLDDAKAKLAKIKFAYDRLPKWIRLWNPIVRENSEQIQWARGGRVQVGTSHRGGTLQYLHVSEFGKICAKYPDKAREIVTGALNTIQAGQVAFIESTAEGQSGRFFDMCETSRSLARLGRDLTELDFKFFFYPWWREPGYVLDGDVSIPAHMDVYFEKLSREDGIELSLAQKRWYVTKWVSQQDDMKREFPATPDEAFSASVEGAIYGLALTQLEERLCVGDFPAVEGVPVHTFWDIGRRDYSSIWFVQFLEGSDGDVRLRVVHFYQNCFQGMPFYARVVKGIFDDNGWVHGTDYFPHDIAVIEWGSGRSRIEQAMDAGFNAERGVAMDLHDGINAVRSTLGRCEFDEAGTAEGYALLKQYRWAWNDRLACWQTGTPCHDDASHAADAFRTLGTTWKEVEPVRLNVKKTVSSQVMYLDPKTGRQHLPNDVMAVVREKQRRARA